MFSIKLPKVTEMNDTSKIILSVIAIVLLVVLTLNFTNNQKTECLANGGKWVTGIVGGNYSAFCIPK